MHNQRPTTVSTCRRSQGKSPPEACQAPVDYYQLSSIQPCSLPGVRVAGCDHCEAQTTELLRARGMKVVERATIWTAIVGEALVCGCPESCATLQRAQRIAKNLNDACIRVTATFEGGQ